MVAPCRPIDKRVIGLLLGILALSALSACGGGDVLEYLDGPVTMLEWDERLIQVRYTDRDGFPIQAATCRFKTIGETNGALLTSRVAITDSTGVCRVSIKSQAAAAFQVVVDADGAGEPVSLVINVSRDAGGMIEVLVHDNAAATVIDSTVIVVKDFDCLQLNPLQPPAADKDGYNTRQVVPIQAGQGSAAKVLGLTAGQPYSVIAIGQAEDQTVSAACTQNLVITEDQILRKRATQISLYVEDIIVDVSGNTLKVQSHFNNEIGLKGIAGLLRQLSDGPDDPVDYVLAQMEATADSTVEEIIVAFRPQLLKKMSTTNTKSSANALRQVAAMLNDVQNIQLHTLMRINDEDEEGVGQDRAQLTIDHKFSHFTAEVDGLTEKYTVPGGRNIFNSTITPKLEDTALLKVDDAEHVQISPHTMAVPIADAIIGTTLMNNFGDYRIDRIITTMIDCSQAGDWVSKTIGTGNSSNLLALIVDIPIRMVINDLCRDTVSDTVDRVYTQIMQDLQDYRADQQLRFQGTATMKLLPDGQKIGRLVNGDWTEIGSFTAKRQ